MTEPQAPATGETVCYRHPNRPTGLRCVSCERPICGGCSTPGSVGQFCPECARQRGRQRMIATRPGTATRLRRGAPITFGILAVTIVAYLITQYAGDLGEGVFFELVQFNPLVEAGEWWRIFTPVLLHAGIMHLLFNMWALWVLGPQIERGVGTWPCVGVYLASAGVGGAFAYIFGSPADIAVGASGAIFGLFGVWLNWAVRRRNTPYGRMLLRQIGFLLLLNAALPILIPNIAWEAHLGGLIAGFVIGELWSRTRSETIRVLITVAVAALAVVAVFVF